MPIDRIDRTVLAAGAAMATPRRGASQPVSAAWRHHLRLLLPGLAALALLGPAALFSNSPAAADPLAAVGACATGVGNAGGEGIVCDVTVVNTITATGGSAVATVHECLGSAGDPTDAALGHPCTTTTTSLAAPVTSVVQCDGSANGADGAVHCSVSVTNNFTDISPGDAALTVNQCVGSGDNLTTGCSPLESTTGAAITQCNGSANGGTLVQLTCTATGTMSSTLPVTIDQCNGSGSGGGGLVICSATMVNNATLSPSPSPTPTDSPSPTPTASPSATPTATPTDDSSPSPTAEPTASPSPSLSAEPTASPSPNLAVGAPPSPTTSLSPSPTADPTASPSAAAIAGLSPDPSTAVAAVTAATGGVAPPSTSTGSNPSGNGPSPLLPLTVPLAATGFALIAISRRRPVPTAG